jgi:uncharacterized membrane protein
MRNWIKDNWLLVFLTIIIFTAGFVTYKLATFVDGRFGAFFPENLLRADWGTLGDFFGGILNPIFAFLGLIMLLVTLYQNQKELSLSRKEFSESKVALQAQAETLEKQRFEDTFFSLLEQHNNTLEKITTGTVSTSESGYTKEHPSLVCYLKDILVGGGIFIRIFETHQDLKNSKLELTKKHNEINQYFRILYQILKFIANNCPSSTVYKMFSLEKMLATECSTEEKMYSNIVRSFLTEEIYFLLAINCACLNEKGQYIKYKTMLERYSFLEHMPLGANKNVNNPLIDEIVNNYGKSAFGDNPNYTHRLRK